MMRLKVKKDVHESGRSKATLSSVPEDTSFLAYNMGLEIEAGESKRLEGEGEVEVLVCPTFFF